MAFVNIKNMCDFTGRVGKDVEFRYTPSGAATAKISIAVSEYAGKDDSGKAEYDTTWVPLNIIGKLAEKLMTFGINKGDEFRFLAKYKTFQYEKDGQTRYGHEFDIVEFGLVSRAGGEKSSNGASGGKPKAAVAKKSFDYADEDENDFPF